MWDDGGYTEDAVACAVPSAPNPNGCAPTLASAEDSGLYSTAPTTLLPSIKSHDLTCVWPVSGATNQSSAPDSGTHNPTWQRSSRRFATDDRESPVARRKIAFGPVALQVDVLLRAKCDRVPV